MTITEFVGYTSSTATVRASATAFDHVRIGEIHASAGGALLKELRRLGEAREALNRAISLANSVAEAKLVRRELDSLAIV